MRFVLVLIPLLAAAAPPQRPPQGEPAAAEVNLNVVALDAKGQSVTDLSADDFRVVDNGKPQKIVSFRRRDEVPRAVPALGPEQYSNRAGNGSAHATVILVDQLNMQFADRGYVTDQLIRALRSIEAADNLYLYLITTSGSLYPVHGLPEGEREPAEAAWTRDIQSRLTEAVRITLAHRPTELLVDIDARVRATFETLSVVAARLAAVPGRKNIVWLTHGVPISLSPLRTVSGDWVDYTPYIERLSETLDRANVSIYAVQQSPPGSAFAEDADAARDTAGRGAAGGVPVAAGLGSEQTLDEFARLTGGRAYQNNDIAGAIRQAVNDARQSYLLAYAPPAENWDGKYHKIRVTCTRKGVRVQTRQGYFAFIEQAATGKQEESALQAAAASPFDAAEIGLRATAATEAGSPPVLRLAMQIDLRAVRLQRTATGYSGDVAVCFVEYQQDGSARQSKPAALPLAIPREQYDAALRDGYTLTRGIALDPGTEKLRVIVFDRVTSALGSLTVPAGSVK